MKRNILILVLLSILAVTAYYFYPDKKLRPGTQIDKIVVHKSKRQLLVYSNNQHLKTYSIALGRQPVGHKEVEGDKKTPEGVYFINDKNPYSGYHKNLGISYPDAADLAKAKLLGKPAGGNIKIHGLKNHTGYIGKLHRWHDWTLGCIAVTNEEMDELYGSVEIGTRIEIYP